MLDFAHKRFALAPPGIGKGVSIGLYAIATSKLLAMFDDTATPIYYRAQHVEDQGFTSVTCISILLLCSNMTRPDEDMQTGALRLSLQS